VGEIKSQWLSRKQKLEILVMIEQAKEKGLSVTRTCVFWGVNRRRVVRWRILGDVRAERADLFGSVEWPIRITKYGLKDYGSRIMVKMPEI
jgi:hypothetical protein